MAWIVTCGSLVALGLAGALGGCGSSDNPSGTSDTAGGSSGTGDTNGSNGTNGSSGTSGTSGSTTTEDSGSDGGATPSTNPDKITCGSVECVAPQVCCAAPAPSDGGIDYVCQADGTSCAGAKVGCDEKADCEGGSVCCMSISGTPLSSTCKETCPVQDIQLCKSSGECGDGGACTEYTCAFDRKVFACSKPSGCK